MGYVKGCAKCQRNKVNTWPTRAPLAPITPKPDANPFEVIALDFITKLPKSQGYDAILTITDHDCTKASMFIPCVEEITAEGTAMLYVKHIFSRFGLPSRVISDCDPCFTSKFTHELCHVLGMCQPRTTPEQTGNRNGPISGLNSISGSGPTNGRITGHHCSLWQNSRITTGYTKEQGSPLSFS